MTYSPPMRLLAFAVVSVLVACSGSPDPGPGKGDGGPNDTAVTPDVSPEASTDAPGPEAPPPPDAAVGDVAPEAGPDAAPIDAPADVAAVGDGGADAPDVARDAALEAAVDAPAPDPLATTPDALSITTEYGDTFTMPTSQRCTASLSGSLVDFSADYMVSGGLATILGMLPLTGRGTLSDSATISVDVTRAWGPVYTRAGMRRVNVRASAMIRTRVMVVTVLGCPVT